jgi:glycosyltransferase involved in cell wall biosynthesis
MMHILIIGLHRFTQPFGLCRYTSSLFTSLKESKAVKVTLVLGAWQKDYYHRSLNLDVDDPDVIWVDLKSPAVSRYFWYVFDVPKLARRLNADVVHAAFPMPFVRRWFTCPIVTTMHDLYAYDAPEAIGYPNVWLNRFVLRQSIGSSQAIISISQSTRTSLLRRFPDVENDVLLPVIYLQVKRRTQAEAELVRPALATDKKFLLCVAQHRKNKNIDLIIESFYKALDRGVIEAGTELVVVGSEGPETAQLKALAEPRGGVRFLSAIPEEQIVHLYKTCEALVCASSIEGFCLPVAEALSFFRRVVSSDIPILREVAGEQATYFALEPRSPDALVDSLQEALVSKRHTELRSALLLQDSVELGLRVYRWISAHEPLAAFPAFTSQ